MYEDGGPKPVSKTGELLTDVVKTARLFAAPFQIAAAYQDRFRRYLDRVVRQVPEERQIPAPARIAGPVFEELHYLDENDPIAEMYISLLAKAIDKEKVDTAHPAFVKVIGFLSPDEALILHLLASKEYEEHYESDYDRNKNLFQNKRIIYQEFPVGDLIYPEIFYVYTSHLISLDLIAFPVYKQEPTWEDDENRIQNGEKGYAKLILTEFGLMFVRACNPDTNGDGNMARRIRNLNEA